jgi:hypothetical protein
MLVILAASNDLSLPPNTGHSFMAAHSIPGNVKSIEYFCLPVTLSAVSSLLSGLPAIVQSFGSLSFTSAGGSSLAAASATFP